MENLNKITLILAVFLTVLGCKKDDIMFFEGEDAMTLYVDQYEADSTSFSFKYVASSVVKDTIFVKIRTQGAASTQARTIKLKALAGTTAEEGTDYILPDFDFPADSVSALYPVILLRSERLQHSTAVLVVGIQPNAFFAQGALGQEIGGSYSINQYKIKFDDFFSQPAYWPLIEGDVGAFSGRKLEFMFEVYGIGADFGNFSTGERLNMGIRLRKALAEYELINGPLIDENGNKVEF